MGRIRGDVRVLGIANLLQTLASTKLEGVLTIAGAEDRKTIHFTPAGIRLVGLGRKRIHTLGEILLRTRKLTRTQLDGMLDQQKKTGIKLGELVVRLGLLSRADIDAALREQAEEEIHDLFFWNDAAFDFVEGGYAPSPEDSPLAEVVLQSNLTSLLLEAARRADEIALIRERIPDDNVIPVRASAAPPPENPNLDAEAAATLLPLLDGSRNIAAVVQASLFPRFTVLRSLYVLAHSGAVRILDPQSLAELRRNKTEIRHPAGMSDSRILAATAPRRTVLLASDLPKFRETLALSLRSSQYNVVEHGLAAELPATASRCKPDAAILDVGLRNPDALNLCTLLRTATPAPIIVLSANTSKDAVLDAIRAGARDYVVKPFKHELLLQRLSQLLNA